MIVCIVRANNDRDALCRLFDTIHLTYGLDVDWSRIDAIACDLTELSDPYVESRIIQLRPKGIVHAAAEVDFLKDYEALYAVNVEATAKLCEIAVAHDVEHFHYVSSMSIAGLNDQNAHNASGYAQTKWVSDTIIQRLTEKGFPANIYRLGEMMPDENCSRPNELAASVILIRAALAINAVPDIEEWLDYTPISRVVDHIATRVAEDSRSELNIVENLWHPHIQNLMDVVQAASGDQDMTVLGRGRFIEVIKTKLSSVNKEDEDLLRKAYMLMSLGWPLFRKSDTSINEEFQSYPLLWPRLNTTTLQQLTTAFRESNPSQKFYKGVLHQ
jgi:thioester reductase-like protein